MATITIMMPMIMMITFNIMTMITTLNIMIMMIMIDFILVLLFISIFNKILYKYEIKNIRLSLIFNWECFIQK